MTSIFYECVLKRFNRNNYYKFKTNSNKKRETISLICKNYILKLINDYYTHEIECYIVKENITINYNLIKKFFNCKIYDDMYHSYCEEDIIPIIDRIYNFMFNIYRINEIDLLKSLNQIELFETNTINEGRHRDLIEREINKANIYWENGNYSESVYLFKRNYKYLKKSEIKKLEIAIKMTNK